MSEGARLDSWLWAARFFKTRSLAKQAIDGGKIHVANGGRPKPSRPVKPGDMLEIHKAEQVFIVEVLALATRRGPAREAEQLYRETPESKQRREEQAALRHAGAMGRPIPKGRPDRRDRRTLRRLRERGGPEES